MSTIAATKGDTMDTYWIIDPAAGTAHPHPFESAEDAGFYRDHHVPAGVVVRDEASS